MGFLHSLWLVIVRWWRFIILERINSNHQRHFTVCIVEISHSKSFVLSSSRALGSSQLFLDDDDGDKIKLKFSPDSLWPFLRHISEMPSQWMNNRAIRIRRMILNDIIPKQCEKDECWKRQTRYTFVMREYYLFKLERRACKGKLEQQKMRQWIVNAKWESMSMTHSYHSVLL